MKNTFDKIHTWTLLNVIWVFLSFIYSLYIFCCCNMVVFILYLNDLKISKEQLQTLKSVVLFNIGWFKFFNKNLFYFLYNFVILIFHCLTDHYKKMITQIIFLGHPFVIKSVIWALWSFLHSCLVYSSFNASYLKEILFIVFQNKNFNHFFRISLII